eukprot:5142698-Alexandrium_andersonii.AAC.2
MLGHSANGATHSAMRMCRKCLGILNATICAVHSFRKCTGQTMIETFDCGVCGSDVRCLSAHVHARSALQVWAHHLASNATNAP